MCLVGTGVTKVTPNKDLRILVTDMRKHTKTLTIGKTIAIATENFTNMTEATIKHGEVLSVAVKKMYRKRPCDDKAEDVVNRALPKTR